VRESGEECVFGIVSVVFLGGGSGSNNNNTEFGMKNFFFNEMKHERSLCLFLLFIY
jgi:hypothetical protein